MCSSLLDSESLSFGKSESESLGLSSGFGRRAHAIDSSVVAEPLLSFVKLDIPLFMPEKVYSGSVKVKAAGEYSRSCSSFLDSESLSFGKSESESLGLSSGFGRRAHAIDSSVVAEPLLSFVKLDIPLFMLEKVYSGSVKVKAAGEYS